ncbi:MAG: deoxyribose-phosphate aldolase [Roseburia sp.]|nr:deoxyribose-phosphate aldolase [Roseburia sp.]
MISTKYFDHTILKADATEAQVAKICAEALENDFASVCVNQYYTKYVAEKLAGSTVKVCTVVGFPLGMSDTRVKAFETKAAIEDGATEIDMVINVGALKDGKYDYVLNDIKTLKEVCGKDIVLKVILETCLLTDEEIVKASELSKEAGADFVKTSTGFSTAGAKTHHVALMRKTVGDDMGVKASGGIHNAEEAQSMIDAGASRLGTSATLAIIGKSSEKSDY